LIHGSSEGRFTIRYAPGHLSKNEIEGVGYEYADLGEALTRYAPERMKEGWNTMPDGEEVFYISTPSAGLWSTKAKLDNPARREGLAVRADAPAARDAGFTPSGRSH
jgi:hypothetical protein